MVTPWICELRGTCANRCVFTLCDGRAYNISFTGGCNGNLKAIAKLCDGMLVEDIIDALNGIKCGNKETSCADQFAKAILAHIDD